MQEASNENKGSITIPEYGDVQFDSQNVFTFPEGILGFEELTTFVLVSHEEMAPFKWLISTKNPAIGFPLLSPWIVDLEYNPGANFDFEKEGVLVVVTLADHRKRMTANMRAPIVLDTKNLRGRQVLLHDDSLSFAHVIETADQGSDVPGGLGSQSGERRFYSAQFGFIDVSTDQIIRFPEGLLGFPHLSDYVIINTEETEPFRWLIAVDEPTIAFPIIDPWELNPDFELRSEFQPERDAAFVIVTLRDGAGQMAANLKAPIVIDVSQQIGRQIILASDKYSPNEIIGVR